MDVSNRALLAIGARTQVSSINPSDGTTEGNACSILFQPTFEALGRTSQWNCLRKQITLTLIAAAPGTLENPSGTSLPIPPTPWLFSYAYPNDCLRAWWIVPSFPANTGTATSPTTINNSSPTWIPNQEQIPYAVSSGTDAEGNPVTIILTNQDQAQLVYASNINNPQQWDGLFQEAMVSSLAAYLVPALSLSLPLMQIQIKRAEELINQARAQDGNEGVTTMDHLPDWIRARAGAQGTPYGYNFFISPFGVDMAWPAYD